MSCVFDDKGLTVLRIERESHIHVCITRPHTFKKYLVGRELWERNSRLRSFVQFDKDYDLFQP